MSDPGVDLGSTTPTCDLCGRRWSRDAEPGEWLGVEVEHAGTAIYASFCCREHAGQWFGRPLPTVVEPPPHAPIEGGERLLIFGVGTLAVLTFGVFVIGCVTVVRTALGWF